MSEGRRVLGEPDQIIETGDVVDSARRQTLARSHGENADDARRDSGATSGWKR